MSEELTKKLLEYLNSSEVFIKEQAPEYVRQALEFYAWDAKLGIALSVFFFVAAFFGLLASWAILDDDDCSLLGILLAVVSVITIIVSPMAFCFNYSTLKKIELAHKVFILEQVRK